MQIALLSKLEEEFVEFIVDEELKTKFRNI